MHLTVLTPETIATLVAAFQRLSWTSKTTGLFQSYVQDQKEGTRCAWVAFDGTCVAGYVTLRWQSDYAPFAVSATPEIVDLNVLPALRKRGIGAALMDAPETKARQRTAIVGVGVGLSEAYGAAQRLYVRRGHVPDGQGPTWRLEPVKPERTYPIDDDLVLWMTKTLP